MVLAVCSLCVGTCPAARFDGDVHAPAKALASPSASSVRTVSRRAACSVRGLGCNT